MANLGFMQDVKRIRFSNYGTHTGEHTRFEFIGADDKIMSTHDGGISNGIDITGIFRDNIKKVDMKMNPNSVSPPSTFKGDCVISEVTFETLMTCEILGEETEYQFECHKQKK